MGSACTFPWLQAREKGPDTGSLSRHRSGVVLGARNEVSFLRGDKYLFPFSFAPSICTGSRVDGGSGERWGGGIFSASEGLRRGTACPRDGMPLPLLSLWAGLPTFCGLRVAEKGADVRDGDQ